MPILSHGEEGCTPDLAHHLDPQRGVRIGTVEAATAEEAIKVSIKEFAITDPERQRRLVAQRIE